MSDIQVNKIVLIERIVSIVLIFVGGLGLFGVIWNLYYLANIGGEYYKLDLEDVSMFKLLKNYHYPIIKSVIGIIGGLFLFFHKKYGWLLSVVFLLIALVDCVEFLFSISSFDEVEKSSAFFLGTLSYLILSAIIYFLFKMNIVKYKIQFRDWIIMIIVLIVLISDSLYFT